MSPLPQLPIELWVQIIELAAYDANTPSIDYTPFDVTPFDIKAFRARQAVTGIRWAIVLVCKQWRAIGMRLLYHDLLICRDLDALKLSFFEEPSSDVCLRNTCVRCITLPYTSTSSSQPRSKPNAALEILSMCPRVEVLVRPPSRPGDMFRLQFDHPMHTLQLPSLRRLDWWHNGFAYRTGGINYLPDVIQHAPNIQYLTLGGDVLPNTFKSPSLQLPKLRVLRLCGINPIYVRQLMSWHLPSLTHIVLESLYQSFTIDLLWSVIAHQIECVELGRHLHFLTFDYLMAIIRGCPNLRELYFHVFFTLRPQRTLVHPNLRRIGLHAAWNASIEEDMETPWSEIWAHASLFANKSSFPSLSEIGLYGEDWESLSHGLQAEAELSEFQRTFGDLGIAVTRYP